MRSCRPHLLGQGVYVRASQQFLGGIGVPKAVQGACFTARVLQQPTFPHQLAKHAVESARANTHSIAKQQQLRPAQHAFKIPPSNVPLPLMQPLQHSQRLMLGNQVVGVAKPLEPA